MLTVLVVNTKGGCGKTTTATHLASAFAHAGLTTALADCDRQRSSLGWLDTRPRTVPQVSGLDWAKSEAAAPKRTQRLVIDAPAAMRFGRLEDLIRAADVIVVPLLPSVFDEQSTAKLIAKVETLKPVRRGKKVLGLVGNRLRPRSRAAARLETFVGGLEQELVGRIPDRAIYPDVALEGLSVFDLPGAKGSQLRADWLDVIRFCETRGETRG
ncbi:MAG: ParA family protein [Geminicoccaceae bacterium]|nr:MAG: ParA family protein [Geminicoccaceae bacterium]